MLKIGVDIEDISRFENKTLENDFHFLNKIYTNNEIDYCFSKTLPAKHLAVRFCAKEAVVKALSNIVEKTVSYKDIEVLNRDNGSPYINLLNCDENIQIELSLSHEKQKAIAFVIAKIV